MSEQNDAKQTNEKKKKNIEEENRGKEEDEGRGGCDDEGGVDNLYTILTPVRRLESGNNGFSGPFHSPKFNSYTKPSTWFAFEVHVRIAAICR